MNKDLNTYNKTITDKLFKFLINADYKIKNGSLNLAQKIFFRNENILSVKKILIFRTGSIGDSVCALPAIDTIRNNYPNAQIDILTNIGRKELEDTGLAALIDKTIINKIIDYYGLTFNELRQIIRERKYDLLIQLPNNLTTFRRELKNLLIVKSFGIKAAFGFEISVTKLFPKKQEKYFLFVNERERLLGILKRMGLYNTNGIKYPVGITTTIQVKIKNLLNKKLLEEKTKNIAFVIGAKREQNKWPIEYFDKVAQYLQQFNYNILIVGNSFDAVNANKIQGKRVYDFCGKLTILETAALLKNCLLTISNDTGPMHLSYAVGTPVFAIFSSWQHPGRWYPPEDGNNIYFRNNEVFCKMCLIENCQNNICMQGIKPETVLKYINKLLSVNIV